MFLGLLQLGLDSEVLTLALWAAVAGLGLASVLRAMAQILEITCPSAPLRLLATSGMSCSCMVVAVIAAVWLAMVLACSAGGVWLELAACAPPLVGCCTKVYVGVCG